MTSDTLPMGGEFSEEKQNKIRVQLPSGFRLLVKFFLPVSPAGPRYTSSVQIGQGQEPYRRRWAAEPRCSSIRYLATVRLAM